MGSYSLLHRPTVGFFSIVGRSKQTMNRISFPDFLFCSSRRVIDNSERARPTNPSEGTTECLPVTSEGVAITNSPHTWKTMLICLDSYDNEGSFCNPPLREDVKKVYITHVFCSVFFSSLLLSSHLISFLPNQFILHISAMKLFNTLSLLLIGSLSLVLAIPPEYEAGLGGLLEPRTCSEATCDDACPRQTYACCYCIGAVCHRYKVCP